METQPMVLRIPKRWKQATREQARQDISALGTVCEERESHAYAQAGGCDEHTSKLRVDSEERKVVSRWYLMKTRIRWRRC